jgi:DNA-binding FadR family transcriptional regulator
MSQSSIPIWLIDPDDPRAPPQELWDRMTTEQRQRVVDELPCEFEPSEAAPPEGDFHTEPVYSAREVLESTVAGMAARFATDAEISSLQHMVEVEASLLDAPDKMFEHNLAFHNLISQAARNRYIARFLHSISDILSTHRRVSNLFSRERRDEVLKEHSELVDAIARRDEDGARIAAAHHIRGALRARVQVQRSERALKTGSA